MEIYKKALLIAFQESIRIGLVSVGLFVAILVLIRKFIKDKALPKWLLWVYTIVGIVIIGVGSVKDFYILHDINEKAYITYYGKYKQRVEGYNDSYYATSNTLFSFFYVSSRPPFPVRESLCLSV